MEINDEYGLVDRLLGSSINLRGRSVETGFENLGYVALEAGVLAVSLDFTKVPFTEGNVENWNSKTVR